MISTSTRDATRPLTNAPLHSTHGKGLITKPRNVQMPAQKFEARFPPPKSSVNRSFWREFQGWAPRNPRSSTLQLSVGGVLVAHASCQKMPRTHAIVFNRTKDRPPTCEKGGRDHSQSNKCQSNFSLRARAGGAF